MSESQPLDHWDKRACSVAERRSQVRIPVFALRASQCGGVSEVHCSSCEAEIYAGAMAAQELRWLTYLLTDLGEQPRSPPVLYVDNKAMLALCQEHRLEHRTKHIALRYFLARELQQRGQLRLAYVASEANTADIFTKALAPGDHQRFCTLLDCVVFLLVPNILLVHSFLFLHRARVILFNLVVFFSFDSTQKALW
ncbi:unnamed protein product [Closterium sp. NIES-54]